MRKMTLAEAADYMEAATIEATQRVGHATINTGVNEAGAQFVLVADAFGEAVVTEAH